MGVFLFFFLPFFSFRAARLASNLQPSCLSFSTTGNKGRAQQRALSSSVLLPFDDVMLVSVPHLCTSVPGVIHN